jgi:hypothetical protein
MPSLQTAAGRPADYSGALTALTEIICRTLYATGGTQACPLHKKMFEFIDPHCIVTFNYDLIADQTLVKLRRLAWHRREYCGSSLFITSASGKKYLRQRPTFKLRGTIPLFKLHGSMNWQSTKNRKGHYLSVGGMPSIHHEIMYDGPPRVPMIVPPIAAKTDIRGGHLRKLWTAQQKLCERPRVGLSGAIPSPKLTR